MPLNRPPLALGQGARGVQDARRWVAELCTEIGRPELVECAQLGVSEYEVAEEAQIQTPLRCLAEQFSERRQVMFMADNTQQIIDFQHCCWAK